MKCLESFCLVCLTFYLTGSSARHPHPKNDEVMAICQFSGKCGLYAKILKAVCVHLVLFSCFFINLVRTDCKDP